MAFKQLQPHSLIFLFIIIFLDVITISYSASSYKEDEEALLKFKQSLKDDSGALSNWNPSKLPCFGNVNNWAGLICSRGGSIWGLRLENMKLSGSIDIETLAKISKLRSISFRNNAFSGPLPDFRKLRRLKGIFLSNNQFDGPISQGAFDGMRRLRKVHLSNNKFNGEIPISLANLEKLVELKLDGNQFQGTLPNFKSSDNLKLFNVSNNHLQGPIPASLSEFDPSAFSGNKDLCGPPLSECTPVANTNVESTPSQTRPTKTPNKPIPIASIIAGVAIAIILTILIYIIVFRVSRCHKNKQKKTNYTLMDHVHAENKGSNESAPSVEAGDGDGGGDDNNNNNKNVDTGTKLTFIKEDRLKFDLPDLLKASAEILGSGCFGSSYKAVFNNGDVIVVKRFKQMNHVGREDFQEHMRRLGRLSHPNLLPLVAYYYRKEEKLFITEPIEKGSLAVLLHGQTRGKPTLDWPTRLKVIKGVAKGLSYLYKVLPSLVSPHGHLKSSNVLLDNSYNPLLSDYALIPLINQESVQGMMIAYKSPEYFNNGRITKKTDVWALGILIIEVLTGKFPASYLQQRSDVDMSVWVGSVIKEGFDKNMRKTKNSEGEMEKLLNIGIACCESNVDKRLDIKEACRRIEEIRERDNDNDFYSTSDGSEIDARSSKEKSDDFRLTFI